MVDMSMGDDDLAQGEAVLLQPGENLRNVISGIDDDSFTRNLVAQDGAVAMERADWKTFKNHYIHFRGLILAAAIAGYNAPCAFMRR